MLLASLATMLSAFFYTVVDTVIAGNVVGEDGIRAMGFAAPIVSFLMFVGSVMSQGASLCASMESGRYDKKKAADLYGTGAVYAAAAAAVVMLALGMTAFLGVGAGNIPAHNLLVAAGLQNYLKGMFFVVPVMFLNMMLYAMFIEEGRENICFPVAFLQFAIKIALSIPFSMRYGMTGLAIATAASYLIGSAVYLIDLKRKPLDLEIRPCFGTKYLGEILLTGFNDSMGTLLLTLLNFSMGVVIVVAYGEVANMTLPIIMNIISILLSILTGLTGTMESLVCLYYGEDNQKGVKSVIGYSTKVTAAISFAAIVVIFAGADVIPRIYGISDVMAREIAPAIRMFVPYIFFFMIEYDFAEYYGCIGRPKHSMFMLSELVYLLPALCALIGGMLMYDREGGDGVISRGLWIGMGAGFLAAAVLDMVLIKIKEHFEGLGASEHMLLSKSKLDRQFMYNINGTPDEISETVEEMGELLREEGIDERRVAKVELLAEELGMSSVEREKGNPFEIEYTLILGDEITLIMRDDGTYSDEIKKAEAIGGGSLRDYVLAEAASASRGKFIPAAEKNRTMFKV